jgi:hypothetical protein
MSPPVQVRPIHPGGRTCLTAHQANPSGLLALAQTLHGRAPLAWMVSVAGEDFGLRETLSPRGLWLAHEALARVEAQLQAHA